MRQWHDHVPDSLMESEDEAKAPCATGGLSGTRRRSGAPRMVVKLSVGTPSCTLASTQLPGGDAAVELLGHLEG